MKSLITIVFTLVITIQSQSQNSISGKITNMETQLSLPGAHAYIPDLQKGTTSDADGFYLIDDLPEGTFLIEIGYLGFSRQVFKIVISGEVKMDFALTPSVTEMSEIVVTGTSASVERELNPVPIIMIDFRSNGESASTNIIDAISSQPGISQITTGGAISKPIIRGLGYNRVIVLNNNIRQEGQQWGDEHGIEIDEFSVDRVEIIKGPGSIMYGSDAMAGVIHFLGPKSIDEGKIIGNITTNFQTNNNLIGYSAMNAGNINGYNWLARLSGKTAGNYRNAADGKVYNSGFEELNFNGTVDINRSWGYSQLHFSSFNQSLGLVEGERDPFGKFIKTVVLNDTTLKEITVSEQDLKGYQIGLPSQDIGHLKMGLLNKFYFSKSMFSVNVAYQQNSRKEFADPFDEQAEELSFLLNTFNYDLKYSFPEKKNWHTSFGLNGMQQNSRNKGEEFLIPEYKLFDIGLYVFSQKTFDKFHLSGGLRYDVRNLDLFPLYLNNEDEPTDASDPSGTIKFSEFNTTFSNVSGSLGASYRLSEILTAKFNVSRGFRSPNLAELGSNGIHEGTFRYELGNKQLTPETSFQLDAGLIYNSEHVSFELAVFRNSIQDYIYLQKINSVFGGDSIVDQSEPASTFQFVQGNANLSGFEFVIDIHPHPLDWLHFENSFSFVRGKQNNQVDSSKYLPFMPSPRINSELRANINKLGKYIQSLYIRFDLSHNFPQNRVLSAFGTETQTPAFSLLNAGIGANILDRKGGILFSVSFAGSNLFDTVYQSHLSRLKYAPVNEVSGKIGVFNMGRNFKLKLVIPLTLKT